MKQRTLILLAAVTAIVVAAAFFSLRGRDASAARGDEPEVLLPALADRVNDAARVAITKDGATATIEKQDGRWTCAEAAGYPADAEKVVKTLRTLALLRVIEPMTKNPAQHAELGLDLESGARMTVADASGATLADVVIGTSKYSRNGQRVYARLADQDQTYFCEGELAPSGDPLTWIDRELVRVDSARPRKVEIVHQDGETLTATRGYPAQTNWDVANVPEGRALASPAIASSLGTALAYLNFEQVERAEDLPLGTGHLATMTVETFDGAVYEVRLAKVEEEHWITLDARYAGVEEPAGPPPAEDAEGAEDADGEAAPDPTAPPPPPDAERQAELRKETEALDARVEGWAFRIPQYKVDVFAKRMESLLVPLQDPAAAVPEPLAPEPADATAPAVEDAPAPADEGEQGAAEGDEPASAEGDAPAEGEQPAAAGGGEAAATESDAPAPAEGDAPAPAGGGEAEGG